MVIWSILRPFGIGMLLSQNVDRLDGPEESVRLSDVFNHVGRNADIARTEVLERIR
jgi:hypothetical protein